MLATNVNANEINVTDIISGKGDPRTNSYLNMIFGPLFDGPNKETLISSLIFSFNVLFFSIGLVLFLYNIWVATVDTANEGEVLGSRHSSVWVPIRIVCAAAALAPVMPGGYNPAQAISAYVVNVGTAAATFFWDETATRVVEQKIPVLAADTDAADGQFLQSLFRMELCRAVYNYEVTKGGEDMDGIGRAWTVQSGIVTLDYGLPSQSGACGKVTLPAETIGFRRLSDSAKASVDDLSRQPSNEYQKFTTEMRKNVDAMVKQFEPLADTLALTVSTRAPLPKYRDLAGDLNTWRESQAKILAPYIGSERINKTAKDAFNKDTDVVIITAGDSQEQRLSINVTNGGWLQAGFYYQLISRMSSDANSVGSMMPQAIPGGAIGGAANPNGPVMNAVASQYAANNTYLFSSAEGDAKKFLNQITSTYNGTVDWWNESVSRSGIKAFTNERLAFADNGGDISNLLPSTGGVLESIALFAPNSTVTDPLNAVVLFGINLSTSAAIATAAIVAFGFAPFIGGAATTLGTIIGPGLLGLMALGSTMAFVLPLMPSIIWVLAIISFFILIIEAIFAAPLWAISHLSMRGHGFAGDQARKGYVLILALLLTPVLMIFGFLAGMIVFRIAGNLLNTGMYYALTGSQSLVSDSWASFSWYIGVLVVGIFMTFVYIAIIELSFSLIAGFPGRVFRWFDDIGDQLDSQSSLRTAIAAGAQTKLMGDAVSTAGMGTNSAGKSFRGWKKDRQLENKNK
ncbi:conjugal transfer/type IV secretion DotA/TraY family protein [Brucella thiophenivorans]|uniref:Conjugal transfer/type IV secretion DotA/TraY family protein n=2 Tax=Brucella thiophenivorans TaxID=571255 RepID=A0A256FS83_9HYPH|nr:conjugal transfer/type IV secretion DotA/TraY family protein [Brucella thiophenivorans]